MNVFTSVQSLHPRVAERWSSARGLSAWSIVGIALGWCSLASAAPLPPPTIASTGYYVGYLSPALAPYLGVGGAPFPVLYCSVTVSNRLDPRGRDVAVASATCVAADYVLGFVSAPGSVPRKATLDLWSAYDRYDNPFILGDITLRDYRVETKPINGKQCEVGDWSRPVSEPEISIVVGRTLPTSVILLQQMPPSYTGFTLKFDVDFQQGGFGQIFQPETNFMQLVKPADIFKAANAIWSADQLTWPVCSEPPQSVDITPSATDSADPIAVQPYSSPIGTNQGSDLPFSAP